MTIRKTADEMALEILLSPGSERQQQMKLTALAKRVKAISEPACPECGCETCDFNGDTVDPMFCCIQCGEHFCPSED
jgi:hypothetical protein